jgi:uncharacterized membrane protein
MKLTSRKFIGIALWQLYIIGAFAVMFITRKSLDYFDTIMQVTMILTPAYLTVQGLSDIKKIDAQNFRSRKVWICFLQVLYPIVGFILNIYLSAVNVAFKMNWMDELVWNAGMSLAVFMGVAWTYKGKKK